MAAKKKDDKKKDGKKKDKKNENDKMPFWLKFRKGAKKKEKK